MYMEIPLGYSFTSGANKTYVLKKVLYVLNQFPRAWFGIFTWEMLCLGYKPNPMRSHTIFETYTRRKIDCSYCL